MRRARRIWSSLVEPAAPPAGVRRGVTVCSLFCASLGATETVRTVATGARPSCAWLRGKRGRLALCSALAICAGFCLGGDHRAVVLAAGRRDVRALAALARPCPMTENWRPIAWGALPGALPPIVLYMISAFEVTRGLVVSMAQPNFAAIAIVGAQFGLLALALYSSSRTVAVVFARRFGQATLLGFVLVRPLRAPVAIAALALIALVISAWRFRAPLGYLPWNVIASVGAALLPTLVPLWALPRFRAPRDHGGCAARLGGTCDGRRAQLRSRQRGRARGPGETLGGASATTSRCGCSLSIATAT